MEVGREAAKVEAGKVTATVRSGKEAVQQEPASPGLPITVTAAFRYT